jgi:hypothetical protein
LFLLERIEDIIIIAVGREGVVCFLEISPFGGLSSLILGSASFGDSEYTDKLLSEFFAYSLHVLWSRLSTRNRLFIIIIIIIFIFIIIIFIFIIITGPQPARTLGVSSAYF